MIIKHFIKKMFAWMGFLHPALGVKVSREKKAAILLQHKTPSIKILVETGTETGWMIEKIGDNFDQVYSIELDELLYNKALEKFRSKDKI